MLTKKYLVAMLCAAGVAQAGLIVDNGAPNVTNARDISLFRSADDFTVGAVTIGAVQFWITTTSPIQTDPQTNFSGSITYAFYNNSAGSIGSLITSGTVSGLVSVYSGLTHSGSNANINVVDFNLLAPLSLSAGTYWLELHEGATLGTSDGTNIGWEVANSSGNAKQGLATNGLPVNGVNNELAFRLFDAPAASVPEPQNFALVGAALLLAAARIHHLRRARHE
jgi:hypothetical protein